MRMGRSRPIAFIGPLSTIHTPSAARLGMFNGGYVASARSAGPLERRLLRDNAQTLDATTTPPASISLYDRGRIMISCYAILRVAWLQVPRVLLVCESHGPWLRVCRSK